MVSGSFSVYFLPVPPRALCRLLALPFCHFRQPPELFSRTSMHMSRRCARARAEMCSIKSTGRAGAAAAQGAAHDAQGVEIEQSHRKTLYTFILMLSILCVCVCSVRFYIFRRRHSSTTITCIYVCMEFGPPQPRTQEPRLKAIDMRVVRNCEFNHSESALAF